jgi:hypothetical protein
MNRHSGSAWLAPLCALLAASLILALHWLDPQYLPARHTLDQYMLGAYGWLMRLAFLFLAAAVCGLAYSLIVEKPGASRLGAFLLLLAGFGFLFSALFPPGPGGVASLLTEQVHAGSLRMARLAAALGALAVAWKARRGRLGWLNLLVAAGLAAAWIWLRLAPEGLAGWQDRVHIAVLAIWTMTLSASSS